MTTSKIFFVIFLPGLLISNPAISQFKKKKIKNDTYLNCLFDTISFSCNNPTDAVLDSYGNNKCGTASVSIESCGCRNNDFIFNINVALPDDPTYLLRMDTSKFYQVVSNTIMNGEICPLKMWVVYIPDRKVDFDYVTDDNPDTERQYVKYREIRSIKPAKRYSHEYFISGHFQARASSYPDKDQLHVSGNFRIKVSYPHVRETRFGFEDESKASPNVREFMERVYCIYEMERVGLSIDHLSRPETGLIRRSKYGPFMIAEYKNKDYAEKAFKASVKWYEEEEERRGKHINKGLIICQINNLVVEQYCWEDCDEDRKTSREDHLYSIYQDSSKPNFFRIKCNSLDMEIK